MVPKAIIIFWCEREVWLERETCVVCAGDGIGSGESGSEKGVGSTCKLATFGKDEHERREIGHYGEGLDASTSHVKPQESLENIPGKLMTIIQPPSICRFGNQNSRFIGLRSLHAH